MVYIYKKIVGIKPYYYLRASERKGKRVIAKDIAYLGNSIEEVKRSIDNLPKYKEQIKRAYRSIHLFIESNHSLEKIKSQKIKKNPYLFDKTEEIESCKLHYNSYFKKLDSITKKEILKNFVIEFAFNTTSIEGNTINLAEARNLLINGLTPQDKTLREIYDLQNTEKVFFDIFDKNEEITSEFMIKIHAELLENIDVRKDYRNADVRVVHANFKATPAPFVKTDIDLLLKWYNENKTKLHPLVMGTIFHHKFEKIHPFFDGNGRTGRMLFNYILLKNNYPPIIIHKKTRDLYLEFLRKADNSNLTKFSIKDYEDLIKFNMDEFIESYWNNFLV
ncbi:MAG: Fic family protein [Candidatus Pacearchaeota archaeon]|jgi:Fic family protein